MRLSTELCRPALVAAGILCGMATLANASVVYSYTGLSTQKWTDPNSGEEAINTYYVSWTAILPDFVTSDTLASYDSCIVTPDTYIGFAVAEECYIGVDLKPGTFDTAWFGYLYPEFSHSGEYALQFAAGAFSKPGTYIAAEGGVVNNGLLTVYSTPTPPAPVPLPAAFPLLAAALGAVGLCVRRRRRLA